jgi:cytochrome c oxidase subunit II
MLSYLFQQPQGPAQVAEHVAPETVDRWGQLTALSSTFKDVDGLFYFTLVVCIFFFVLITGVLGWSVIVYRRKTIEQPAASNVTHHTMLEVVWTVIPLIIVMVIFAWGWKGSLDMSVVPAGARQYKAVAAQWNWTFFYPNDTVSSANELWLERGKPAAFTLEAKDVLHAFYMPSMRVKRDVIPGRLGTIWFEPTEIGDYHLFCAEYCGKDHSQMYAKVHVVSADAYAKRPWDNWDPKEPAKGGEKIYQALCKSCHNIDGTKSVGPPWNGLYGKTETVLVGGPKGTEQQVVVDDAYILESIRNPPVKLVKGFQDQNMTAFDEKTLPGPEAGPDKDRIRGIIEFIKSLAPPPGGNNK